MLPRINAKHANLFQLFDSCPFAKFAAASFDLRPSAKSAANPETLIS
jgi:hypothetical protein